MRNDIQANRRASPTTEGTDGKRLRQSLREFEQALRDHVKKLLSPDANPVPSCPRCKGTDIDKKGYTHRIAGRLPAYLCAGCGVYFNRLSDTPLSHRSAEQIDLFISLLCPPLSCAEAARQLGMDAQAVCDSVRAYRQWLCIAPTIRGTYCSAVALQ